jgi:plasmid maintenance system antidote protein VapI
MNDLTLKTLGLLDTVVEAAILAPTMMQPEAKAEGVIVDKRPDLVVDCPSDLDEDDILTLQAAELERSRGRQEDSTIKLRTKHHEAARLLTLGYKQREVASHMGMAESTLSKLVNSTAFQSLLAHYMDKRDDMLTDVNATMSLHALENLERVQERIREEGSEVPLAFVQKHAMNLLDRTGHGPEQKSSNEHKHIFLTEEDIKDVKAVTGPIIDAEYTEQETSDQTARMGTASIPSSPGEAPSEEPRPGGARPNLREKGSGGTQSVGPSPD